MKLLSLAVLLTLAGLGATGCNRLRLTAIKQKTSNELKKLCDLYGDYYQARGYAPASVDDLEPLAIGDQEAKKVLDEVRSGHYVILWGADIDSIARTKSGMAFTVLGYEQDVPKTGGLVLMADGSVLEMNPKEFAKAAKGNQVGKDNRSN